MEDCRDLKKQVEELIQKGRLQKYVKKNEYNKFRTSAIRTSIANFTKIMATTWKIVGI